MHADKADKMVLLRNYDLWSYLTDEEYEDIKVVHNFLEAKKGDYIYFESFMLDKLFFIKEGFIRIGFINEKGEEVIREIIQKGEVFGQFTLTRQNIHGEFAQAHKTDVSLCAFNISDFEKILARKPFLAIHYSKKIGQKLRNAENRIVNLLHKDVRSRLLGFIYNLAIQQGCSGTANEFRMESFLTHDDIARLIGSSRQTVTSIINEEQTNGLFEMNRKEIFIPDVNALLKAADVG